MKQDVPRRLPLQIVAKPFAQQQLWHQTGDVILIAGKGHEPYQEIEGVKHHFDDHEEVRAAFGIS